MILFSISSGQQFSYVAIEENTVFFMKIVKLFIFKLQQ